MNPMPGLMVAAFAFLTLTTQALAQETHTSQEIRRDIQRHRAMAAAHEAAARCLESRTPYDTCLKQLQAACAGLGIGKHCGMKHEH